MACPRSSSSFIILFFFLPPVNLPPLFSASPAQQETMRFHPRPLTMMHEPDGGNTFAGVVIIKPFFFSPPPQPLPCERNTKALCPKCNALISLKLFIGVCGALAAGLSPFQLPALFNSAGNEKCSELRQRRRACAPLSPASASLSFSPSNHHSRGKRVGKDFLRNYV